LIEIMSLVKSGSVQNWTLIIGPRSYCEEYKLSTT
jgi:hypothetical protein